MIPARTTPRLTLAALALLGFGCTGQISQNDRAAGPPGPPGTSNPGPGGGSSPGANPGPGGSTTPGPGGSSMPSAMPGPDGTIDSAGPVALRRLTLLEYQNTVRDLLGVTLTDADRRGFSNDQVVHGGFGSGAAIVTSTDSRQFLDVSGKVAAAAVANLGKLLPDGCAAPAAGQEEGCIDKFIDGFGLRAFRRPVTAAEKTALKGLYTKLRSPDVGAPFNEAVHDLLLAIIQSPEFLYRWELDGQPIKDGDLIKFGPYEIASRLSYLIWASMPDDTLFAAAKAGQLGNPDQIAEQARRLLKDDRAKEGLRDFYMQWLSMYGVDELEKDPIFPTYTPEVAKAMLGEASAFVSETLFAQGGKLEALLTSTASFVNEPLAKHYGVQGITGTDLRKVDLNPTERAGILTRGAFLARHSKEVDSFPIMRGLQVLHQVLCQVVPEPTIMLPPPPEQQKGVTTRKLYEDFTKDAACQVCHTRINGVGFAFEHYDASGAYRDTEENQPIDSSGKLELASGTIEFKNAIDFSQKVAKTPEARDCLSRNWLRFLLRREESKLEGGSLKAVNQTFEASNYDMRELIVSLTKTRAFTHRNPDVAAGKQP